MRLPFKLKIVDRRKVIFWLVLVIGFSLIHSVAAYYIDEERGPLIGESVALDFILEASPWSLGSDADDLDPGESVTRTIQIVDDAPIDFSTAFKYGVRAVQTGGDDDFCTQLQLEATMDGAPVYTGALFGFDFSPVTFDPAGSLWTMRVYLPDSAALTSGQTCGFNFIYRGWQERFSIFPEGYHDEEEISNELATSNPLPQECRLLDFDTDAIGLPIVAGQKIDTEYQPWGVVISADNAQHQHPDLAIAFDSDAPTGGDVDLGTPHQDFGGPGLGAGGANGTPGENQQTQHGLLIIAENAVDANADDLIDTPDDEARGGKLIFTFDQPTRIKELRLFDIEETGVVIKLYDESDTNFATIDVPSLGDNSAQTVTIDRDGVKKLKVILTGSGAVDDLCFIPPPPPPSPPEDDIGCSPGFWKNHQEIWFDANDPADVALLEDLQSRGPGSGSRRLEAAKTLNREFPEIAIECGEDLSEVDDEDDGWDLDSLDQTGAAAMSLGEAAALVGDLTGSTTTNATSSDVTATATATATIDGGGGTGTDTSGPSTSGETIVAGGGGSTEATETIEAQPSNIEPETQVLISDLSDVVGSSNNQGGGSSVPDPVPDLAPAPEPTPAPESTPPTTTAE